MIYGQDEPVALPTMDLYDRGLMQMYVNAVRELYNAARDELKEFLKAYGDFYSPFAKDNEYWYNNTIGRVNDLLSRAQANGIDLTRSAEGRALVAQTMRSIPYGELANVRQNAKAGEEYLKNVAALLRAGKYNQNLEDFLLQLSGLGPFDQFSSANGKMWNRISPTEYQDLYNLTNPWFEGLAAEDLGLTPDGRYRITGIGQDKINRTVNANIDGFLNSDLGRYYYDVSRRLLQASGIENPTDEAVLKNLRDSIGLINSKRTMSKVDEDQYALTSLNFANQMKLEGLRQANENARHAASLRNAYNIAALKNNAGVPSNSMPLSITEALDAESGQNGFERTYGPVIDNKGNVSTEKMVNSIIKWFDLEHALKDGDKYYKSIADFYRKWAYTKGKFDENKLFNRWKRGGVDPSTQLIRIYNKSLSPHRFRNYNKRTPGESYNMENKRVLKDSNDFYTRSFGTIPVSNSIGKNAYATVRGRLFGYTQSKYNGSGHLSELVNFGDKNLRYTPLRRNEIANLSGSANLSKRNMWKDFEHILKTDNIEAWATKGRGMEYTRVLSKGRTYGDYSGYVSVPKEKLEDKLKGLQKYYGLNDLLSVFDNLNISVYDKQGLPIKKGGKLTWENVEYLHIPVTRVTSGNDIQTVFGDLEYLKGQYGQKVAYGESVPRQAKSIKK